MARFILLVDDDRDFLEMNRGALSARGYRVHCAPDLAAMHADARFDKPVDPAALVDRVEELLR